MSIAQVKKRLDDMSAYIGRDQHGIDKLRELKDAVWVIRARLASLEEDAERSAKLRDIAIADAAMAKASLERERLEIQRLRQIVETQSNHIAARRAKEDAEKRDSHESPPQPTTEGEMIGVIRALRKRITYCPRPVRTTKGVELFVYRVSDFVQDWSHQSLWTLGAAVAVLSEMEHCVVFETSRNRAEFRDQERDGSYAMHLCKWIARNIKREPDALYDKLDELKMAACDYS